MKLLIINPTETDKQTLTMLSYGGMIRRLVVKVLQKTKENFSPVTFREHHVGIFIGNIEPKLVAANLYAGAQIETFDEAQMFFNDLGKKIYENKFWITKVISNEVFADRNPNARYGFNSTDQELILAVKKDLEDLCKVEVRDQDAPIVVETEK